MTTTTRSDTPIAIVPFDWDNYFATTPYNQVLDGMEVSRLIIPTCFSPDKSAVYLKTLDVAMCVDDTKPLQRVLSYIYESMVDEAQTIDWSFEKMYLLQVDYLTVYNVLATQNALPEGYRHPEYYLERLPLRRNPLTFATDREPHPHGIK